MTFNANTFVKITTGVLIASLAGCSSLKNTAKFELADDYYDFKQQNGKYRKAYAYVGADTIRIYTGQDEKETVLIDPGRDLFFLKHSFDLDVMTVAFKYRPGTSSLPRQLTTDFNGNVYIGYRLDRFRVTYRRTPVGKNRHIQHRAITTGGFLGLGSTAITPWTTNNRITDEYSGLVLSRGFAVMVGLNNLTVGAGLGFDFLTDRDKDIWIYQNKPWYGVTIGLNVN